MKIAFILGAYSVGSRPLNFNTLWQDPRGLTGTDLGIIMNAREMVNLGHDVSFFTIYSSEKPAEWNGLKLYTADQATQIIDESFDAVVSYNEPDVFRGMCKKPLKVMCQMLNDFNYCLPNFDELVDVYTSPSKFHMEHIKKFTPSPNKWKVVPLGCDSSWYSENRVPGRVIWASSADRGLHLLLQEWSKIKKAVPEANLRMFYNFNFGNLTKYEPNDKVYTGGNDKYHSVLVEMGNRVRYIKAATEKLKRLDVEMVGSVSRERMQKEMSEAMVLAYPISTVNFTEGFSVTSLESCAAGVVPVLCGADAIKSIYGKAVPMIESPAEKHMEDFVELVIKGLTDEKFRAKTIKKCKALAEKHSWRKVTMQLEKVIKEGINEQQRVRR